MDLKKKEEPVKKVDMWKKEPVVKADVPKEPVKQEEVKVLQKDPIKEEGFTTVVAPNKEEPPAAKVTEEKPEADSKKSEEKEKEKKRREPEKVNSRAAAFETSAPVSTLLLAEQNKV
jgi:hypothetical protein